MALPTKNVALANIPFYLVLSSDHLTPATGKTPTMQISKDGGAFAACTNAAVEVGNGLYTINLTQAEMNCDVVVIKATSATTDQQVVSFFTV
jgi:hypothetical protein